MTYKAIGLMSGSSLDGLDMVFAEFTHHAGTWSYELLAADCKPYTQDLQQQLQSATGLNALNYQLLHTAYGRYLGEEVNRFIEAKSLDYQVAFIASHGHTTFHLPAQGLTAQLGDGAAIAAATGLPVISDLRALDVAHGGQGAPIVPIGEKLLLKAYKLFLNLGGIANISVQQGDDYIAYDVCPANRVLNLLAAEAGKEYDEGGTLAASGTVHQPLLQQLAALEYYNRPYPKSLPNSFGVDEVYPLIKTFRLSPTDALRTYVAHIAQQVRLAIKNWQSASGFNCELPTVNCQLLLTGGGAFNTFLVDELKQALTPLGIEPVVPDTLLVNYKEALIMAFIGVLRWRQEYTVLPSVTGAKRGSIGGALWSGGEE